MARESVSVMVATLVSCASHVTSHTTTTQTLEIVKVSLYTIHCQSINILYVHYIYSEVGP